MAKDILLIYPGEYGEPDPNFPSSLLHLAKPLLESGFTVEILDTRISSYKSFDFSKYKIIGISVMTVFYKQAQSITEEIRRVHDKAIVVWGGHHPTLVPKEVLKNNPLIDFILCGEGEIAFEQLCKKLLKGETELSEIGGLGFLEEGQIVLNDLQLPINLDETIGLPYHLVSIQNYPKAIERFEFYTSRGCPHGCTFCSNSLLRHKWRGKSPQAMVDELENIIKLFSPKLIQIFDANFFANKNRAKEFCEIIIEKRISVKFYAMGRCDYFAKYEDEFLKLLSKAGFLEVAMGGESGSSKMLKYYGKAFPPKTILESVENCVAFNIKPILSFILASPHEILEDLYLTLDMYDEIINRGGFINGIFLFVPYPGSKISKEIEDEYGQLEDFYTKSLYDIKGIGYHTKEYEKICQAICYCAHILHVHPIRRSWSFSRKLKRDKLFMVVVINDVLDLTFYKIVKLRWKYRFFKYAFDLKIYWFLRNRSFRVKG